MAGGVGERGARWRRRGRDLRGAGALGGGGVPAGGCGGGGGGPSWRVQVRVRAGGLPSEGDDRRWTSLPASNDSGFDAEYEVPREQRPINELASLKEDALSGWACLETSPYFLRLGAMWLLLGVVVGSPVSAVTFQPGKDPVEFTLAAAAGAAVAVMLLSVRTYLAWTYVGDRLFSAVVEYEESGWYDGQTWVKTPEVLTRDRLAGAYEVRPVVGRLRNTLLGGAGFVVAVFGALSGVLGSNPLDPFRYEDAYPRPDGEGELGYAVTRDRTIDLGISHREAMVAPAPGYDYDRFHGAADEDDEGDEWVDEEYEQYRLRFAPAGGGREELSE